jgi:DNA topoisomerase IB
MAPRERAQKLHSYERYQACMGISYDVHRLPAGKTAAERRARDVLQVRQRNCQKIDDIDCASRHSFI